MCYLIIATRDSDRFLRLPDGIIWLVIIVGLVLLAYSIYRWFLAIAVNIVGEELPGKVLDYKSDWATAKKRWTFEALIEDEKGAVALVEVEERRATKILRYQVGFNHPFAIGEDVIVKKWGNAVRVKKRKR